MLLLQNVQMKRLALVLGSFMWIVSSFRPVRAADVIDASLRLRFNFDSAPANNVIVDSSPSGTHPGTNIGAIWTASENGRNGVMDFKAPIRNRITVPAIPALNSSKGTISFWIKTSGNLVFGDFAAILFDRRTQDGDVITLTDDGTIFVQARAGGQNMNSFAGSKVINDNNWHHVAYVYDQSASGSISIFIDGALDTSQGNSEPADRIGHFRRHVLESFRWFAGRFSNPQSDAFGKRGGGHFRGQPGDRQFAGGTIELRCRALE